MASLGKSLNVIALISGGKDSFLSILQCQKLGHKIVALANLYPPKSDASRDEDLNSHLYQTAGHAVIPFYEQATGLPLYRREINGSASRLELEYDASYLSSKQDNIHDETEDLFSLLQDVLKAHPDANAVCSGAILSNYQRTRIEDVCLRLNLTSLAYLWQMSLPLPSTSDTFPAAEYASALLDYFDTVGLDARIVKVASGGLVESYLWQSLSDARVRQRIRNAMRRFGGSVVGEGGEFETLVLSGPPSLIKGHIDVDSDAYHVRRGQGGEAWLDIDTTKIRVVDNNTDEVLTDNYTSKSIEVPRSSPRAPDGQATVGASSLILSTETRVENSTSTRTYTHKVAKHGGFLWIGNAQSSIKARSCRHEMELIVEEISRLLSLENLEPTSLVFVTIVLRDMQDFQDINMVWKTLFSRPLPPARVTIAAGSQLPPDTNILISCMAMMKGQDRKIGLHVQSISYWAPANIGPYSQAISIPVSDENSATKIVFIAGQIPLVPETMLPAAYPDSIVAEEFQRQAVLALRHARRIGSVLNVSWFGYAVAFVCSNDKLHARDRANMAHGVWKATHEGILTESERKDQEDYEIPVDSDDSEDYEDQKGPDIWEMEFGGKKSMAPVLDENQSVPSAQALRKRSPSGLLPGFLAVHVESLPRNQMIEWQTVGFSGKVVDVKLEDDFITKCELYDSNGSNCCASTTVIIVPDKQYGEPVLGKGFTTMYGSAANRPDKISVDAVVPCHELWGAIGDELSPLEYGMVIQWYGDNAQLYSDSQ